MSEQEEKNIEILKEPTKEPLEESTKEPTKEPTKETDIDVFMTKYYCNSWFP